MKRRKVTEAETGDANAWMTTFSDLLTLLLTFFVLLLTMSSLDNKKMEEVFGFFGGARGVLNPAEKGGVGKIQILSSRQLATEAFGGEDFQKQLMIKRAIINRGLKSEETEGDIRVQIRSRGVVFSIDDQFLFDSGKAKIESRAFSLLKKLSSILREYPHDILVEGHTDNVPIHTERFPSNWELSLLRAVNVAKFFISVGEIYPGRLSCGGYGDCKPLFPNDHESGRKKNRRVEILLVSRQ